MPLRKVTAALSVQNPLSETRSYVSKCPSGISSLWTHAPNIGSSTKPTVSSVTIYPPYRKFYMWQLVILALHSFSYIWWPSEYTNI